MPKRKPKIGFFSLTSCEGCQFVLLDLGEKLFNFLNKVDLIDFSLIEDRPFPKKKINPVRKSEVFNSTPFSKGKLKSDSSQSCQNGGFSNGIKIDVAFVEGNPITKEDLWLLKKIREEAKFLVALGNCAALGGIPEIKNYQNKERTIRFIYKKLKHIANPEIREIDNFVKVDFIIPGCPISGQEFLKFAKVLIQGKIPQIPQCPVCVECPLKGGAKCFLARKEICLGLISLAGCEAVCPKSEMPCQGCRGLLKKIDFRNFLKILNILKEKKEIEETLEIYGLKDEVEKFL